MLTKHQRDVVEAAQLKQAEEAPEAEILHLPPIASPITPTAMLSEALQRGGVPIETLERLMGMSERYEANNSRRAFYAAMSRAKAEIAPIIKSKTVGYEAKQGGGKTSYRHETLEDVMSAVDPALSRHGLWCHFETDNPLNEPISVTCIIAHHNGYEIRNTLRGPPDNTGSKNGLQAIGSTLSYLSRYAVKSALGLAAAEDDDGVAAGGATISEAQEQMIRHLVDETGSNIEVFLKTLGVQELSELPLKKFDEAMRKLSVKLAQTKKQS